MEKSNINEIDHNNTEDNKKSNTQLRITNDAKKDDTLGKKKKPFQEREGDWNCFKCKNLNFSFRVICNRCQLSKKESEQLTFLNRKDDMIIHPARPKIEIGK